eukprot:TRINITY_DN22767_c1_g1_i2.p1 TRINITY_DN22767_c1_g1~~TRINITY_DN22767_c1_g1_i2.p1  ORF type:complete len:221 (-),score=50.41 TRINITY_DN22767_c1_g1_i2:15-677(-)
MWLSDAELSSLRQLIWEVQKSRNETTDATVSKFNKKAADQRHQLQEHVVKDIVGVALKELGVKWLDWSAEDELSRTFLVALPHQGLLLNVAPATDFLAPSGAQSGSGKLRQRQLLESICKRHGTRDWQLELLRLPPGRTWTSAEVVAQVASTLVLARPSSFAHLAARCESWRQRDAVADSSAARVGGGGAPLPGGGVASVAALDVSSGDSRRKYTRRKKR